MCDHLSRQSVTAQQSSRKHEYKRSSSLLQSLYTGKRRSGQQEKK